MNESPSPTSFVAPEPSELTSLFPGYEIHDLIATGGMGAVYRAVQISLDRTVAIKILPKEFSADAEFRAGFEAEAKAMARLNHPNLIAVYDFGSVNGMLFIVMEFVPGKSIFHSAYGQAIDPGEVVRLISSICGGLAHAHENGILHRDIKPSNILLTTNAEPKIGDFGLARSIDRKSQEGEEIFGTPGYNAPEVIDAPHTVDHRADIFSMGVLLHELLTGKLPTDDPRPASVICGCDRRFDAIVRRATNPDSTARYSSAAEVGAELQIITAPSLTGPMAKAPGAAITGPVRPAPVRRGPVVRVKRKSPNLSWIGPLVALGVIGFSWFTFMTRKPQVILTVKPAVSSSTGLNQKREPTKVEDTDEPATSPPSQLLQQPSLQATLPSPAANARNLGMPEIQRNPVTEVKIPEHEVRTVFNTTDLPSLRDKRKQHATVQGRVLKTGVNHPGTMRFLNFTEPYGNSLSVMMLVSDAPDQFVDSKLKTYEGKTIRFSGIVEENQGALQIRIRNLAELRIMEGETPSGIPKEAYMDQRQNAEADSEISLDKEEKDHLASLKKLVVELTKVGNIDQAQQVQSEVKALEAKPSSKTTVAPAVAGEDLETWKKKALEEFPALKLPNSEHSRAFKALRERKESMAPGFFTNPQWPYLLAKESCIPFGRGAGMPLIPAGAQGFNGKKYFVYEEKCSWTTARDKCKNLGGQLVVIPDQPTQVLVKELAAGRRFWLGATDETAEGRWIWVDGTEMKYKSWGGGEPNNFGGKEHYLRSKKPNGNWMDGPNDDSGIVGFICEWRDPAAGALLPQK